MFQQPKDGSSVRLKKSRSVQLKKSRSVRLQSARNVAERLDYPDAVAGVLFVVDLLLLGYNVFSLVL